MPTIHSDSFVDRAAELGDGVFIGPGCVVGPGAKLGAGVRLDAHVVVSGPTTIGEGTRLWPFAVVGAEPQVTGDDGATGRLEIGARCSIREHATVHRGSRVGAGLTRVGDGVLMMVGSHVGHDGVVGDGCTMANSVHLGGHVQVGDGAILGGGALVHQFTRIGAGAFVGGGSVVVRDVVPYGLVQGNHAQLAGLNLRGLRRRGVERARIRSLQALLDHLFGPGDEPLSARIATADAADELEQTVLDFVRAESRRGYCRREG